MKKIIIKLASNRWALTIAKKIFVYFPSLKYFLINYVYSNSKLQKSRKIQYKSNFLEKIKLEIETRKTQKIVK